MSKRLSNEMVCDAIGILVARGFAPTVTNGGKHFKVSWVAAGRQHVFIISGSPSDCRTRANSRAELQRLLRKSETQATVT